MTSNPARLAKPFAIIPFAFPLLELSVSVGVVPQLATPQWEHLQVDIDDIPVTVASPVCNWVAGLSPAPLPR
jgi:hypothetical protein